MGAALDTQSRIKFNLLFRALLQNKFPKKVAYALNIPIKLCPSPYKSYSNVIPKEGLVYDYRYTLNEKGKGKWTLWTDFVEEEPPIPQDIPFNEIIVPTVDTIRHHVLISMFLESNKPLMTVGETGTGKSANTMVCLVFSIRLSSLRIKNTTYSISITEFYVFQNGQDH